MLFTHKHTTLTQLQIPATINWNDNLIKKAGPGGFSTPYDIVPIICPETGNRKFWHQIPKIPDFNRVEKPTSLLN